MKNRLLWSLSLMVFLTGRTMAGDIKISNPESIDKYGKLVVRNLINRDYMLYPKGGLHYPEACAGLGAFRFCETINDQSDIDLLVKRYSGFLDESSKLIDRVQHVDYNVKGIVPLQVYLTTGDERFRTVGLSFADSQWNKEIEDGLTSQTRWWIDDMYMIGSLQMQAYRATGDPEYADRAARQIHVYIDRLQQPNGLFFHGPKFKYHWGRGNGWVAASMAELLKDLPKNNPHRKAIEKSYKLMMASLLEYQSENGLWRQLIDDPYSWTETSCTAMFAYAMAIGVETDVLDQKTYAPAVEKAWQALCAHINRDGNIRDVCEGTGQTDDPEFYLNRRRITGDFHGQAPFLWLAAELAQQNK
ncbi:MAG: glycoside hydrolase family 88 protein [Pontiellaceae bacterium]|nr:glycoside hydrolase family 88 protein [Pontiellaceae bacterium]MBN2783687.1 glycoside hydrolase family 88 protein [Pontiellaceae bacterium]